MLQEKKQWLASLQEARELREPVDSLAATYGGISIDEAYAVQRMMIEDRCRAGERIIGWKVGATSQAVMEQLEINEPVYGCMTSTSVHSPDEPLMASDFCRVAVEGEIAFVMGRSLRGPGIAPFDVLSATAGIMGAVELVDCRMKGWKGTIAEIIADNALHAGLMLGPNSLPIDNVNLPEESVALRQNGRLLASASGKEALGNPLNVVTWLANKLAGFGLGLREGDIVLTGSLTKYFFLSPWDDVEVTFSKLGAIQFTVI